MTFLIAQIIGVITAIIAIGCVQFKNEKILLLGYFFSNILTATSCALLGGLAGAWICLVAAVQTLIVYFVNKRDLEAARKGRRVVAAVFAVIYIVGTILTFSSWPDIVVCVCALLYTTTVVQENSSRMRTATAFNMALWIVYDITIGAYTNIITHALTLVSTLTAKIRLDRKK